MSYFMIFVLYYCYTVNCFLIFFEKGFPGVFWKEFISTHPLSRAAFVTLQENEMKHKNRQVHDWLKAYLKFQTVKTINLLILHNIDVDKNASGTLTYFHSWVKISKQIRPVLYTGGVIITVYWLELVHLTAMRMFNNFYFDLKQCIKKGERAPCGELWYHMDIHTHKYIYTLATFTHCQFWGWQPHLRTGVSLKMSLHSNLQWYLEYCLYERATGVKPVSSYEQL